MKIKLTVIILIMIALMSCDSSKSVSKDLITGLTARGDGLSCENVYLSDGEQEINRNSFTYGEKVYVNFENIEGFKKEGENVFPGLRLCVINHQGDTVMIYSDLYADYHDGISISPLLLQSNLTVADPIHSGNEYTLYIDIWDKNGEGTFKATLDFDVIPDEQIIIEKNNISYDEVYLFTMEGNNVIIDDEVNYNENIYLIFEGLDGFQEEGGKLFLGLSIKIWDKDGEIIMNEEDLIGDEEMEPFQIKEQLAPNFIIRDTSISSPVSCEIVVWDKRSNSNIRATVKLNLK